jgi:hypothetical protein
MTTTVDYVLAETLAVAVPLRMAELAVMEPDVRARTVRGWAARAADVVSSRGDQLMFRVKPTKGEGGTADTFNHLAKGLAALAHAPGGVVFAGTHWCVEHRAGVAAETPWDLTCGGAR